ncbi:CDK-activating kinase assembly factor MAT1 [Chaetoceros tenuissimus]|uniref:CDK-activating kinase assembly factor MAT1 n=1 Tax=Chaetoceros tenuissimus TaxID=426638 RepID=A0AAD3CHW9_9STRA|nr:CDK-activating kinase assembly factor MAT1 [Chaetoceros tenuissimus]
MENDDADLFRCAVCGMSEGDSSNFTQSSLQTNAAVGCGHQFCMSCVDRELSRRKVFPCPICETLVKRVTLSTRSLDDIQCEKDTSWRRRVTKVYNKTQKDFKTLLEYNNYLEEVEDIIWAIVNEEPNAEEMKNRVKRYEIENKAEIATRQSVRADEDRFIADRIAAEQRDSEKRKREFLDQEREIAATKRRFKQESLQVSLGEREEVSKELIEAQRTGYKNVKVQRQKAQNENLKQRPKVRVPMGGYKKEKVDRELYLKRQAAGGGISSNSEISHEKNWNFAVSTLFAN